MPKLQTHKAMKFQGPIERGGAGSRGRVEHSSTVSEQTDEIRGRSGRKRFEVEIVEKNRQLTVSAGDLETGNLL
jgi:hypothetical protein